MKPVVTLALIAVLNFVAQPSSAQEWCIPGDGCTGPEPITPDGFNTCEETCSLRNPVPVRGMDATLYDVSCRGDSLNYEYRTMIGHYSDEQGKQRAFMIGRFGPAELERCP
jgi:hypothetical protein